MAIQLILTIGGIGLFTAIIMLLKFYLDKKEQLRIEKNGLAASVDQLQHEYESLLREKDQLNHDKQQLIEEIQKLEQNLTDTQHAIALELQQAISNKDNQISSYYLMKMNEIEKELGLLREDKRAELEQQLATEKMQLEQNKQKIEQEISKSSQKRDEQLAAADAQIKDAQAKVAAIIAVMREEEAKEQQELFHTLQISSDAREDIILLEQLLRQLHNKDVVQKLVWTCYYQPAFQELTKRLALSDGTSGIYKITNLKNNKTYIGKSTNVRNRWSEHIKGALGISNISAQFVHSIMREDGIWNFGFYLVEQCDKDKLSEREKFYIQFFQSNEFGYNKTQ